MKVVSASRRVLGGGRPIAQIALLLLCLVVLRCAHAQNDPSGLPYSSEPSVQTYRDPSTDFARFQTFSVFPDSVINPKSQINEIEEREQLFFLRSCFEAIGYRFVPIDQKPDLLVTIEVRSEYRETYVPPKTITLPAWVPDQRITTSSSSTGSVSLSSSNGAQAWGSYSGSSSSVTTVPGHLSSQTVTKRGYSVGHYYPVASVRVFDGASREGVWMGAGAATSNNPDPRVSGQILIDHILTSFPKPRTNWWVEEMRLPRASPGFLFGVLTVDGNSYFPIVTWIKKGSPAGNTLKVGDGIRSVDGVSVENVPYTEVWRLLAGQPHSVITLGISREGKILSVTTSRS